MKSSSKLRALRYFSILAFQLFSIFPLAAILDTNTNGMSDLWEKQHNNGELYSATFFPTADPDQDGWDNATEAVAGTDPFEPNPPDGIVVTQLEPSQTQGAYTLTWPTIVGKRYRFQASYDLDTWSSVGNSHFATESSISIGINAVQPDTTVPPKIFWRIIIGDVDDDGDGLTNAEEHRFGTNPLSPDTDEDGLDDLRELELSLNASKKDTDGDGVNDKEETDLGYSAVSSDSYPPRWRAIRRTLTYDFYRYSITGGSDHGKFSVVKHWEQLPSYMEDLTVKIDWPDLNDKLEEHGVFPAALPIPAKEPLQALGSGLAIPAPPCLHLVLFHTRVWLESKPAVNVEQVRKALKITKRDINGEVTIQSEVIDVTIPPNRTTSEPIDLEPEFESNPDGSFLETETVSVDLLPIEVVDASKNMVQKLKFAKLAEKDVLTGTEAAPQLDPDKDPDRFFIRLKNADNIGDVSVKVSTFGNPDNAYNDNATEIILVDDGDDFISQSMLMVSDDVDDGFAAAGIADDALNDRTHKAQLDGKLKIDSIKIGNGPWMAVNEEVKLPAEKKVEINIVRLADCGVTAAEVDEDIKIAKERLAQVGVKLVVLTNEVKPLPSGLTSSKLYAKISSGPFASAIGPEVKIVIDNYGTPQTNDLHVFYMNEVKLQNRDVAGYAWIESFMENQNTQYSNNIAVAQGSNFFTMVHEMGHVLTNRNHFGEDYLNEAYTTNHNLMKDGTSPNNNIFGTKRLIPDQKTWMQQHQTIKEP
jgi:hypothetical protein